MVNTRSTTRRLAQEEEQRTGETSVNKGEQKEQAPAVELDGELHISKKPFHNDAPSIGRTKRSSSASIIARKRHLELAAAEEKARIQMQLIDKKLEADMAALDEEYSSHAEENEVRSTNSDVEKWLERSHDERLAQPVRQDVSDLGELCPPAAAGGGTESITVQMLASALKDMAAISKSHAPNSRLLSRISTQKDLPVFAGDPLEWLQFKQAYNESTEVCNFTPRENLWRLRSCLRGPAKEAVIALLIGATTPDTVMNALELQFGNPDVIISRIVQDIQKLPIMSQEYHKDIVKFSVKVQNFVAAVISIGEDEYLKNMNIMSAVLSKFPTVLLSKWTDYSYPLITEGSKAKLIILSDFLREEAVKTTKTAININYCIKPEHTTHKRKYAENNAYKSHSVLLQSDSDTNDSKCRFCRNSTKHNLPDCKMFQKALRKDRWFHVKRYGICFRCLVEKHSDSHSNSCSSTCDIKSCGLGHHRLLHYEFKRQPEAGNEPEKAENQTQTETQQVTHVKDDNRQVLLKTITVQIHGPHGIETASALLDDGSTVTLICADLAERLGLCGLKKKIRMCGAWNSHTFECDSEIVSLTISNKDGQLFTFEANSVKNLNLPVQDTSHLCTEPYKHISEIESQISLQYSKPQMLIGQDNYHLLLPLQVLEGKPGEPYATLTPLGWCLHGSTRAQASASLWHSTLLVSSNCCDLDTESEYLLREMHEEVRRSFTVESPGVTAAPRENADDLQASTYLEKTSSSIDGRWYVGLPWKDTEVLGPTAKRFITEKNSECTLLSGDKVPTKRKVLRVIMSIFNVFGFLSLFTIKGKLILFQDIWKTGLDWDESFTGELHAEWAEWLKLLKEMIFKQHTIKSKRKYFWNDSMTVLHWMKDNARNYQTFIAHRLGETYELLTSPSEWRYVSTTRMKQSIELDSQHYIARPIVKYALLRKIYASLGRGMEMFFLKLQDCTERTRTNRRGVDHFDGRGGTDC
ncbi:uncharacterized protein LOC123873452 [Maniola jurtina]|uniref:uncharacterized protein LOC123873452 n=1 Tax=Maniola jurtina TaxID=191418 RepID=UPI001E6886E5|nr:uncharacterized protein LOC123873452 [Maniola jurtina]